MSPLTEGLVRDVARAISRDVGEIDGYRHGRVLLGDTGRVPPEAARVPQLMMQLVYDYTHSGLDALAREAGFHVRFEHVHPFADGNGRTGRILLARGLVAAGLPPAVIEAGDRDAYFSTVAGHDYAGLAAMVSRLSEAEGARMRRFARR